MSYKPMHKKKPKKDAKRTDKNVAKKKIKKVMHEFKAGELHSGSKSGPTVENPKQAIAIALSESRKKVRATGARTKKKIKKVKKNTK